MKYSELDNALDNKIDTQKISSRHDLYSGENVHPEILAGFNDFKSSIEGKIDNLSNLVSSIDSVSRAELSEKLAELEGKIKESKLDAAKLDSARRTFGEEVGLMKSHIDKQFREFEARLSNLDKFKSAFEGLT